MTTESPLKSRHWDIAAATLEALREYNLSPVPELFHVWFVYFADENPDIFRTLDMARQQGTAIDEKQLLELYHRFILHRQTTEFLRQGMENFADVIENSEHSIASVTTELNVYNKVLDEADAILRRDGQKFEILGAVARHTRQVQQTVTTLADQLHTYHQQISHLQVELQKAREQSFTDGLTRVSNRLHFEQLLADLTSGQEEGRDAEPFSLLLIDLDQFKQINDRYGHRVGDEILVLIAKILKSNVKGRDTVSRYGGDEFTVLLPQTTLDEALFLAEDLCNRVRAREVRAKSSGTSFGHMTISIGVAEYQKGEGPASLVDRADNALYRAKQAGRDQYSVAVPFEGDAEPAKA
ncbi:GGDEF domain-containing protein [Thalassospira marina]|uniref:diguanylate cyclase n=1 Tax=Thalassospira marina TaxID=2048283 RepID=A0ABN5FAT5_9PROT|nr:GGDEF domain-containing protein [Thalassospira marina]AUG51833.1 GGDEF domain-containing protein [Thalassospira marina]